MSRRAPCETFEYMASRQLWEALAAHIRQCVHPDCKDLLSRTRRVKDPDDPVGADTWRVAKEVAQKYIDILERFQCVNTHDRNKYRANLIYCVTRLSGEKFFHLYSIEYHIGNAREFITDTLHDQLCHTE